MPRGAAGGAAAFALTAWLAADNGGFDATTWNLALLAVCAVTLVVVLVDGGQRPTLHAMVFAGAFALLTAWTALSYFWSDSPPLALVEAQRAALYFTVAFAVVLTRRWLEPRWLCAGVAGAATLVAAWNLVLHIRGLANAAETGGGAAPVGYANSLALLCVIGAVALIALPRPALAVAPVLVAELVVQSSTGAWAALAVALLVCAAARRPPALLAVAICCAAAAPFALRGHERTAYWHVAVREAKANPVAGSGAGTFADWWLRERTTPLSTKEAHSLYLETLAELGPLGLVLILLPLAAAVAAAFRGREPAIGAAVVAYAVGAAVDFHWELPGATVPAVLLGAAAVSCARPQRSSVSALPVLVPLIAATVLAYAGNERLASARDALSAGDNAHAEADARSALRFAPFSADAWEVIGDATHSAGAYRRGIALDRHDWNLWHRLAAVTDGEPHRLASREAARLNPLGPSEP
jgi:O-Antigen ligase